MQIGPVSLPIFTEVGFLLTTVARHPIGPHQKHTSTQSRQIRNRQDPHPNSQRDTDDGENIVTIRTQSSFLLRHGWKVVRYPAGELEGSCLVMREEVGNKVGGIWVVEDVEGEVVAVEPAVVEVEQAVDGSKILVRSCAS